MALPTDYDSGYLLSRGTGGVFATERDVSFYIVDPGLLTSYGNYHDATAWNSKSTAYWQFNSTSGLHNLRSESIGPWAYEEWISNFFIERYGRFGTQWSWVQQAALEMFNNPSEEYKFVISIQANPL